MFRKPKNKPTPVKVYEIGNTPFFGMIDKDRQAWILFFWDGIYGDLPR